MKEFIKFLLFVFSIAVILLMLLDLTFTKVYENAKPRTKIQYLRSLENKNVDYIFLGSSRVENTVVPNLIAEKTGKSAVSLGFQASKMSDIYTVLKLIVAYNIKCKKIFIQVDYIFNIEEGYSNVLRYELMPFVRENNVTKEYFDRVYSDKQQLYYAPFYRYCDFDSKIGFREFVLNLANKETRSISNKGFAALQGNSFEHNYSLPSEINSRNSYYEKIIEFTKRNKMSVNFFCAPFCRHIKNLNFVNKLKQKIPGLYDFSAVVQDDGMFQNCMHLNEKGATYFTNHIIEQMLTDQQ